MNSGFSEENTIKHLPMKKVVGIIGMALLLLVSCKNEIEEIENLTRADELPDISGENVETVYIDSSVIRLKITAPKLVRFTRVPEPYYEFPEGIHVYQYDHQKNVIAEVSSRYAHYNEAKRLWTLRKNVIAKNLQKNEQLATEELFWDEIKGIIYTEKFVAITNPNGVFYGEKGFEADQQMEHWKLKGSKGTLTIKEKE